MHSLVISFLGRDCPGIVAAVSSLLEKAQCDIVALSQAISSGEFAAIFTVSAPISCTDKSLHEYLEKGLAERKVDLSIIVRPATESAWCASTPSSPFVVTAYGPNRTGLVAALSTVFADHNVNIENLKAIFADEGDNNAFFLFEVQVPNAVVLQAVREQLRLVGEAISVRTSMQHRDIFEAINRVAPI